ncbi:hypothetical protein DPEC_G00084980 [Dallia pectoralis]|uniref:Uncharacterized protein n=1 Tax=Dallia pectoralis TaxID=75939 RepID=A0ACC2H031_DALPE|nr:hypothetical protein DPEC_G00084980 [Dallia pectoralis]
MDKDENGKGQDADSCFLDNLMNKLYDFGDGSLSKRKHKSKKRPKQSDVEDEDTSGVDCSVTTDSIRQVIVDVPVSCEVGNTTSVVNLTPSVEVVTFQDPTKRPRQTRIQPVPNIKDKSPQTRVKRKLDPDEFNLEKARLEVHRFGITGYHKAQQRVFEQERAIMLGAKPPKKEYVNYKVLQKRVMDMKQKAKEETHTDLKKKKAAKPREEKRKSSSSKAPTGQVGRFKNGMLILNSKEIKKIKSSRVAK